MSNRRNRSGRFSSGADSKSDFDLLRSVRGLFRAAEKSGDYAGAASLARVLKDLDPGPQPDDETYRVHREMLWNEREDLRVHLLGALQVLNRARKRQGLPEAHISSHLFVEIKAPEPRPVHVQVYPPAPTPRARVQDEDVLAHAPKRVVIDPLEDYVAGDPDVVFGGPLEIKS